MLGTFFVYRSNGKLPKGAIGNLVADHFSDNKMYFQYTGKHIKDSKISAGDIKLLTELVKKPSVEITISDLKDLRPWLIDAQEVNMDMGEIGETCYLSPYIKELKNKSVSYRVKFEGCKSIVSNFNHVVFGAYMRNSEYRIYIAFVQGTIHPSANQICHPLKLVSREQYVVIDKEIHEAFKKLTSARGSKPSINLWDKNQTLNKRGLAFFLIKT